MLSKIEELREKNIRFQIMKQNCNSMVVKLLKIAGIDINIETKITTVLKQMLPLPQKSNKVKKSINKKLQSLPSFIKMTAKVIWFALTFFPKIIINFTINLLLLALGCNKGSPKKEMKDDVFEEFEKVGYTPVAENIQKVDYSSKLVKWQLAHPNTWAHNYRRPSMNIAPPIDNLSQMEDKQLKHKLQKLYLNTQRLPA